MLYDNTIYKKAVDAVAAEIPADEGSFLVTGASGLIGSCIIDVLLSANHIYGKKFSIYAMGRNADKLAYRFGNNRDIHFVTQNVVDPIAIEGLNYIVHAASNSDPKSYALYPVETILTNVIGAKNVLDYCKVTQARALLTSTFEVYGKLDQDEYSEDDFGTIDLNLIRNCYPDSKRTTEMLFRAYHDEYGVDCVIARLSSIYGPTMQKEDSKAHAQFLRSALAGEDIVLKSKGTQKRTYCYVIDAVNGLLSVLLKGKTGEAYNVANENSVATIAEVAETIAELSGTKVIFHLPDEVERKGFSKPQNCVLKTDKIKKLGWSGKYDLKHGLSDTLRILLNM